MASPRFRMIIFNPRAATSSILIAVLLGLRFRGNLRSNDGDSCKRDVMREHAVVTFIAFAFGVKGARAVVVVLAVGLITLTLKVSIAEELHVGDSLASRRP